MTKIFLGLICFSFFCKAALDDYGEGAFPSAPARSSSALQERGCWDGGISVAVPPQEEDAVTLKTLCADDETLELNPQEFADFARLGAPWTLAVAGPPDPVDLPDEGALTPGPTDVMAPSAENPGVEVKDLRRQTKRGRPRRALDQLGSSGRWYRDQAEKARLLTQFINTPGGDEEKKEEVRRRYNQIMNDPKRLASLAAVERERENYKLFKKGGLINIRDGNRIRSKAFRLKHNVGPLSKLYKKLQKEGLIPPDIGQ